MQVKPANVYILIRPLQELGRILSYLLGDPGKHWGLILEFKDKSEIYLCETYSIGDPKQMLVGSFASMSACASGTPGKNFKKFNCLEHCKENNPEAKINFYGTCDTNVDKFKKIVDNEAKKFEYNLLTANCQSFVLKIIELLKVKKAAECQDLIPAKVAVGEGLVKAVKSVFNLISSSRVKHGRITKLTRRRPGIKKLPTKVDKKS